MGDRTNATASTAGILRPDVFARHVELERLPAAPDLAPWVENHWVLRWDLPDGVAYPSQVLPHPTCNLTVERGEVHPDAANARIAAVGSRLVVAEYTYSGSITPDEVRAIVDDIVGKLTLADEQRR